MARRVRTLAAIAVALALAIAAIAARDLEDRVGRPYPGFVLYQDGLVGPPFLVPRRLDFRRTGLHYLDLVTAVDGRPVRDAPEIWARVEELGAGATPVYTVEHTDGSARHDATVRVETFTRDDFDGLVLPFFAGGLLLLAVGAIPIFVRPDLATGRVLFLFCVAVVTNFCFLGLDFFMTYRFTPWSYAASWLAKASAIHLALVFPLRRWPMTRAPRATLLALYGGLALFSGAFVLALERAPAWIPWLDRISLPTFVLGFAGLVANLAHAAFFAPDAIVRQRARVVLAGPVVVTATTALLTLQSWSSGEIAAPVTAWMLVTWVLPLSMAYAILKQNLFEFERVVRRGLTLGIVVLASVLAYLGAFVALQRVMGAGTAWAGAVLAAGLLLVLVPVLGPLRRGVESLVEETLFPSHRRAVEVVHEASRELARLREPEEVARLLRSAIARAVQCTQARVLLGAANEALRELVPAPPEGVDADAPMVVEAGDPLRAALARTDTLDLDAAPARLREGGLPLVLHRRLLALGARLVVPLAAGEEPSGVLLLGARDDGRLYTSDDRRLLETLAAQAAVSLANATAWREVKELQRRLDAENVYLRQEVQLSHRFDEIVGESVGLRAVLAQVEQVAPTDATVLVLGETGTGKELVVRAIHALSARRERVLVRVACAAIPETLLESELFGHEKGAFTGATARKPGRFEVADGGTLFLDDVDTLPPTIQAKLLRALQEGELQRLGSNEIRRVDVRVVAASNRDLQAEVRAGRFREDLYYRLHVVPIRIPPLRERREDVPLLAQHYLARESAKLGRTIRGFAPDVMEQLVAHGWPGNVRELRNWIERAVVMCREDVLRLSDPLAGDGGLTGGAPPRSSEVSELGRPLADLVREYKVRVVTRALAAAGGNQRRAAELLGLHRPSLTRMIRELGLREGREARPEP